jgi:hypothetical protein
MTYRVEKGILQYKPSNKNRFVNIFKKKSTKPRKEFVDAIRNRQITTLHESLQNNWVITNFKEPNLESKKKWFDQRTKELVFKPSLKDKGFEYNNGIITNPKEQNLVSFTTPMDLRIYLSKNKNTKFHIEIYDKDTKTLLHEYRFKWNGMRFRQEWDTYYITFYKLLEEDDINPLFVVSKIEDYKYINKPLIQYFQEGETNCLITPIKNFHILKKETLKNKKSKMYRNSLIIECNKLEKKYSKGVPNDSLQEIANTLKVNLIIKLPFNTSLHEVYCEKNALGTINYSNWKKNHVDILEYNYATTISQSEFDEKIKYLDENKIPYVSKGNKLTKYSIATETETYTVDSDFMKTITTFEIENNINFCRYDAIKYPKLYDYIHNSIATPSTIDFVEKLEELDTSKITHIDQEKCYANLDKCPYHQGIPRFTDFRKTDSYQGIGIYSITNLDFTNCNPITIQRIKALNILQKDSEKEGEPVYIVCSPWLLFFNDRNIKYNIIEGAWGIPFYLEYSEDMYKKYNKAAYYSWISGMNELKKDYKETNLHNFNEDIINQLKVNNDISFYENKDETKTYIHKEEKKVNFVLNQLASFNKCYTAINVMIQLEKMDLSKLIRICVDGIYTFEKDFELVKPFRIKDDYHFSNPSSYSYIQFYQEYDYTQFTNAKQENFYRTTLALGAGGTGKSHHYLTDTGLLSELFITPTHKLGRSKRKEYNCDTICVQKLCTDKTPKFITFVKRYPVLLIDEASMLTKEQALYIINTFNKQKIIFMGDIGFQLPPYKGKPITLDIFDNIVEFKKNYRIKCPKLAFITNKIREMITENKTLREINDYVFKYLRKNGCYIKNGYKHATIDDLILCSTNEEADAITEYFKGKFAPLEKYYTKSTNKQFSNGDIIISDIPPKVEYEIRHAFTIHSTQGETIKKNKLFISEHNIFSKEMLYTALSRVEYMDQIVSFKILD